MASPIYLDNAATSFPKPDPVYEAVNLYMRRIGAVPTSAPHTYARAARKVLSEVQESVAHLIGAPDPGRVMLLGSRAEAMHLVLHSILRPGDTVVVTTLEHRSLLAAITAIPNIRINYVEASAEGYLDTQSLLKLLETRTRLVCCSTASSVPGSLLPVAEVIRIAHEANTATLVDASDTVGLYPLDVWDLAADFVIFTGHRWMLSPPGTGVLYAAENVPLPPHPGDGLDMWSWAGGQAALKWIAERGLDTLRADVLSMAEQLRVGLSAAGLTVYGTHHPDDRIPVVCANVPGRKSADIARILAHDYHIAVGAGDHNRPLIHRILGTTREGTLRLGVGAFNRPEDINAVITALQRISAENPALT